MKLDVFGRYTLEVVRRGNSWAAFYCGNEGKKRLAQDFKIPDHLPESEVVSYVADIFHEFATPQQNQVKIIA